MGVKKSVGREEMSRVASAKAVGEFGERVTIALSRTRFNRVKRIILNEARYMAKVARSRLVAG